MLGISEPKLRAAVDAAAPGAAPSSGGVERVGVVTWLTAAVFALAALLSYTDRYVLNLLLEPLRRDLALDDTQVSVLIGAAFAVMYALVSLPLGRLADRVNRRNLIAFGILIWSAGTVVCGLSPSFATLFAGRLIVALGEASLAPAVFSIMADLFPPRLRGRALGLFLTATGLGNAASLIIGGALMGMAERGALGGLPWIGALAPWRITLVLVGLPGVIVALLVRSLAEPPRLGRTHAGAPPLRDFIKLLFERRGRLATMYAGLAMFAVADLSFTIWRPTLFVRQFGFSSQAVGLALGAVALMAAVAGSFGGGWFGDWLVERGGTAARIRYFLLTTCIMIPAALLTGVHSPWIAMAAIAVSAIAGAMVSGAIMTSLQEQLPNEYRGLGSSLSAFVGILLGVGAGPTLVALCTEHIYRNPHLVGLGMATVAAPSLLIAVCAFRHTLRNSESPGAAAPIKAVRG